MSLFFLLAFDKDASPYWACHYAVESHPRYHRCFDCEENSHCDIAFIWSDSPTPEDDDFEGD